jgi:hypothetical protein
MRTISTPGSGRTMQKDSIYYLDPKERNGEVKVVKPADPTKIDLLDKRRPRGYPNKSNNFIFVYANRRKDLTRK